MSGLARIAGSLLVLMPLLAPASGAEANGFLPAGDPAPLLAAIAAETPGFTPPQGITGISVPHHLLAANLIARGYWAASAGHYDRVIVISPDHFHVLGKPFGTTAADLDTVFGVVASDRPAVAALSERPDLVETLPSLAHEHGVMVEAPFIRHFFPEARVLPILAAVGSTPDDWRAMLALLRPLVTPTTLIVQSTDYSHYRPIDEAIRRDQESIAAIDSGDPDAIVPLLQPSHMDSKAAQYIQLALQRQVFGASPVILANSNSADFGGADGDTTSYVVTAFVRDPAIGTELSYADQTRLLFGGDVLLGRYLLQALHDPKAWTAIRDAILAVTHGAPLIVNLEGVLLGGPVTGADPGNHAMVRDDAAPMLAALAVTAASLANNHANDLGSEGRAESARELAALGITPLQHGSVADLGSYRVLPLNFVAGRMVGAALADPGDLDWVCGLVAAPPVIAFVHWGAEYTTTASAKEHAIAGALARCGVALIVGAHSHQASGAIEPVAGGGAQMVYSLGNLVFDQHAPRGSGALLEVRVFRHGTVAARLVPVANVFDLATGR